MKILIADDHSLLRRALTQLVKDEFPVAEIQEAENGQQAFELLKKEHFNIAILDLTMPERDGLDVLKQLSVFDITTPVLVLSMHPEELYAKRVLRSGASGYLSKDCNPDELIAAVKAILAGGNYVSVTYAGKLAKNITGKKKLHENLSDRELQVLKLYAQGKSTTETIICISFS